MDEDERERLLQRVGRRGATIGATIPDTVDLDGTPFHLGSFVFEVKSAERVPAEKREEVEELRRLLRRERRDRKRTLEAGEVSVEEGEALADAIVGIDRALDALADLESADLEEEMADRELADRRRWLDFLKQVT